MVTEQTHATRLQGLHLNQIGLGQSFKASLLFKAEALKLIFTIQSFVSVICCITEGLVMNLIVCTEVSHCHQATQDCPQMTAIHPGEPHSVGSPQLLRGGCMTTHSTAHQSIHKSTHINDDGQLGDVSLL